MSKCIAGRLQKLRDLRTKLCDKEKNWKEAFEARDWIVGQLKTLHALTLNSEVDLEEVRERVADLLCVLDPEDERSDHDK